MLPPLPMPTRFALLLPLVLVGSCSTCGADHPPAPDEPGAVATQGEGSETAIDEGSTAPAEEGSGGADEASAEEPESMPETASSVEGEGSGEPAVPEWVGVVPMRSVADRVAAAHARLDETEAGRRVRAAIDAHGGLPRWYENGPMQFRFRYVPVEGLPPVDTEQLVDTWSARAVHRLPNDHTVRFGWDGERAWQHPPGAELGTNARFWALTPYYFVAIPFVLGDAGVNLELVGELEFERDDYDLVRATFAPGTGDAPGDYYVVLIDQESHRVGGVRYIVSYPGFFPDGGHSPEKLFTYDGDQIVDGITLPERFRAFPWSDEDGVVDEVVTNAELTDVRFFLGASDADFAVPAGAEVLESW